MEIKTNVFKLCDGYGGGKVRGDGVGKKKVKSEEQLKAMVLPVANDVIGIAKKMIKTEKLPEPLITVAEENLYAFMTVRGEERDNA